MPLWLISWLRVLEAVIGAVMLVSAAVLRKRDRATAGNFLAAGLIMLLLGALNPIVSF